MLEVKIWFNLW